MRDGKVYFDAILRPHRSLSPLGFFILMAIIVVVSFLAGLRFVTLGAWPVAAFFALDAVLIYIAFRLNFYRGRRYETITLTDDSLLVRQVGPRGDATSWKFQPYWLRVELVDTPANDGQLTLRSHGCSIVIGAFLPVQEREELAHALAGALARQRAPRFD